MVEKIQDGGDAVLLILKNLPPQCRRRRRKISWSAKVRLASEDFIQKNGQIFLAGVGAKAEPQAGIAKSLLAGATANGGLKMVADELALAGQAGIVRTG